jgi:hypothetical protein
MLAAYAFYTLLVMVGLGVGLAAVLSVLGVTVLSVVLPDRDRAGA